MAKLFAEATYGYPVIETTQVAAVRSGQMRAQFPMSSALIAAGGARQGQLLYVNEITGEVGFPASANDYVYLHCSEEQIYQSELGRNSFILQSPKYPRMLQLNIGDKFETNAVDGGAYNITTLAAALAVPTAIYGVPSTNGDIALTASLGGSETVVLQVVGIVTLPNGYSGIKFVVLFAGVHGTAGYVGSLGYTGSTGYLGSTGYVGSAGYLGSTGYVGSAGYLGSTGYTGSVGYTGSGA